MRRVMLPAVRVPTVATPHWWDRPSTPGAIAAGRVGLGLTLLAVWQVGTVSVGAVYVPEPAVVLRRLLGMLGSGESIPHLFATVQVAASGLLIAATAAGVLAPALSAMPRAAAAVDAMIAASAGIPKYAIMPLLVLWLGIGAGPTLALVTLLAFYPLFFSVRAGIRAVDRRLIDMIRVVGGRRLTVLRLVVWPSLTLSLFAGVRVALPRAMSAAVIGELLVGDRGLGFLIESARQSFDTAAVCASAMLAGGVVLAASAVTRRIERKALAWRTSDPGGCDAHVAV
jgi:NitT/TauT family transport system permease protein